MVLGVLLILVNRGLAAPCIGKTIGMDSTVTNGHDGPVFGEALGQVFWAADTLIQSITVWRWAVQDTNFNGIKLYITDVTSGGYPDVASIVLDGPILSVPYGDGINPIPFNYVFDPPFSLPHKGPFCFALQTGPTCIGTWAIYVSTLDPYPDGAAWIFGQSVECRLRAFPTQYPNADLTFRIRFCDAATPIAAKSWGTLKIHYR